MSGGKTEREKRKAAADCQTQLLFLILIAFYVCSQQGDIRQQQPLKNKYHVILPYLHQARMRDAATPGRKQSSVSIQMI